MGGQLHGIFLAGSLPHEFIILIVTLFICLWLINFSLSLQAHSVAACDSSDCHTLNSCAQIEKWILKFDRSSGDMQIVMHKTYEQQRTMPDHAQTSVSSFVVSSESSQYTSMHPRQKLLTLSLVSILDCQLWAAYIHRGQPILSSVCLRP